MAENTQNIYLKYAKLSGYKSIKETEVEFKDGLNIIIGKNASGKTNFLTFLNKVLQNDFEGLGSFEGEIKFSGSELLDLKIKRLKYEHKVENGKIVGLTEPILKININNQEQLSDSNSKKILKEKINLVLNSLNLIQHGIPKSYPIVNEQFDFQYDEWIKPIETYDILFDSSQSNFIRKVVFDLMFTNTMGFENRNEVSVSSIGSITGYIKRLFSKLETLKIALRKYSPIEDFQVKEDSLNVRIVNGNFVVNNFFLEFKIEDNWYPFSHLSDGTKRLFYLISEICTEIKFQISEKEIFFNDNIEKKNIILLEEPELGIHPHQLHSLMQFLKEQARTKQIIITTHSPQVLDILGENELDNIIIAYTDNHKKGTQLRHLSEAEKEKAKKYMQEDYLSDYWKHSDLEKR